MMGGHGLGPGTNCLKIHVNFLSFFPIFPTDLSNFPQTPYVIEFNVAKQIPV